MPSPPSRREETSVRTKSIASLVSLVLGLVLVATPLTGLPAIIGQSNPTYVFSTGLTITVPTGWSLDANPLNRDELTLVRRNSQVDLLFISAQQQIARGLDSELTTLLQAAFPNVIGDNEISASDIRRTALANGRIVFQYNTDAQSDTVIYASFTQTNAVLFAVAEGEGTESSVAALQVLQSMDEPALTPVPTRTPGVTVLPPTSTPRPTPTPTATPRPSIARNDGTPFELPTPAIITLSSIEYNDGTRLRYPANWRAQLSEAVRDLAIFEVGTAIIYADLYLPFDFEDLSLSGVGAVMAYSYVPFSAQGAFDASAVAQFAPDNSTVRIFYWRYVDGGFSGTQLAAELPNGAILVMDAFDVEPNTELEAVVFAMLFDAAGDPAFIQAALRNNRHDDDRQSATADE